MFDLPDKMPDEAYKEIARRASAPVGFLRALAIKESHNRSEDPNSIRFEKHHWRKKRLNHKAARAFDRKGNPRSIEDRWDMFHQMNSMCREDAPLVSGKNRQIVRWAAVSSHSFTVYQIMGFNAGACGFHDTENFFKNLQSIDGHIRIVSGFFRNSERLVHLANNFDISPRHRKGKLLKLGDLSEFSYHYNGRLYERNRHDSDILKIMKDRDLMHV